jgi:hypothetical protein
MKTQIKRALVFTKKTFMLVTKGRALLQTEKGQGVTRTRAGAAPCKNGLARTLFIAFLVSANTSY